MTQSDVTLATRSFRRDGAIVAGALAAVNLLIASIGIPRFLSPAPTVAQRALAWCGLCLGPLAGWVAALVRGEIADALPMLMVVSGLSVVPLGVAVCTRSVAGLVVSATLWLAAGYLFTIAIWV